LFISLKGHGTIIMTFTPVVVKLPSPVIAHGNSLNASCGSASGDEAATDAAHSLRSQIVG
jgi:hypothetical protein